MSALTAIGPALGRTFVTAQVRLNKLCIIPATLSLASFFPFLLLYLSFFNSRSPVILSFSRFNSSIFRFIPRLTSHLICLRLAIRFGTSQI